MKKTIIILSLIISLSITFCLGASPVMNSSTILPTVPYNNDDLLGYCNATDGDDDSIIYSYEWYNGTNLYENGVSYGTNLWNLSTINYLQEFYIGDNETTASGLFFKPDGKKVYVSGSDNDRIYEYDLSIAWNISSSTYHQFKYIGDNESTITDLYINSNGSKLYFIGFELDKIYEYDLIIPWNISSATYSQEKVIINNPEGIYFKSDGTRLYTSGNNGLNLNEYNLSIPWNISSLSYIKNISFTASSIFFKDDGTKLYGIYFTNRLITEYSLNMAWNISSIISTKTKNILLYEFFPTGIFLKESGTKLYTVGYGGDAIDEYNMGTLFDESTEYLISTLPSSVTLANENWVFSCLANDGLLNSSWLNSSSVTISNHVPTFNQSLFTWTISHGINDTLQLNASDLDLDTLSFTENNTLLTINTTTGTMSYVGSNDILRFGTYNVSINVTDGLNATISSFILNLTNTKPSVDLVTILSGSNLTFTNTTTDLDNDTITDWSYVWYNNSIRINVLDNQSIVNSSYLTLNDNWIISLSVYDGIEWSDYTNSTSYIVGDGIAPITTDGSLSASSGVNDAPFTIYTTINETNNLASVLVTVIDTNAIATNFTMNLYSSNGSIKVYSKIYTPGNDGVYNVSWVYATDGNSNEAIPVDLGLTYTESTSTPTPTTGGGGGTSSPKKTCNIEFAPSSIDIVGRETVTIIAKNNDDVSFIPNIVLPKELMGKIIYTIPTNVIFSGQAGQLNFINTNPDLSGEGVVTITSSNCEDITIPINIRPKIFQSTSGFSDFLAVELFELWGLSITNSVIGALGFLTGLAIALPNKKFNTGMKWAIVIGLPMFLVFIFNFMLG